MRDNKDKETVRRSEVLEGMNKLPEKKRSKRRFLKSSGGIAGLLATFPGISSITNAAGVKSKPTKDELKAVRDEYGTLQAAQHGLRTTGADLLKVLANRGLIQSADVASLGMTEILPHQDSSRVDEGVIVLSYDKNGVATAQIQVIKQLVDSRLRIIVEPHAEQSFALVEPNSDEEQEKVITADGSKIGTEEACVTSWHGDCNHNPNDDCSCTESDPCGCYQTEVKCCQDSPCSITGYKYGNCVTTTSGCCTHYGCSHYC